MAGKKESARLKNDRKTASTKFSKGNPGGPGRPKGPSPVTVEAKAIARAMICDADYLKGLRTRLMEGSLVPAVQAMLWYYGFGKPKDTVEHSGPNGGPLLPGLTVILESSQAAA